MNIPMPPDMMLAVQGIYLKHRGDRVAYEQAAIALIDNRNATPAPADIREIFVKMCLDVYDLMENEEQP